jgi:Fic family protein
VRGDGKRPGDYRTGQVYIGGSPFIEEARYVPPPAERVPDLMDDLLTYVNRDDDLHPLLRAGLVHYQFETIHPFFDGNGRLGRLLVSLLFQRDGILPEPYLYLSSFFNAYKQAYMDRMLAISQTGEWDRWIKFFLEGVRVQAVESHKRANILVDLREEYREQYQGHRSNHILPLIMHLFEQPYLDVNHAADWLDVDYSTAHRLVKQLQQDGVLEEITGRDRNRFYRGTRIFETINKPIEVDE